MIFHPVNSFQKGPLSCEQRGVMSYTWDHCMCIFFVKLNQSGVDLQSLPVRCKKGGRRPGLWPARSLDLDAVAQVGKTSDPPSSHPLKTGNALLGRTVKETCTSVSLKSRRAKRLAGHWGLLYLGDHCPSS